MDADIQRSQTLLGSYLNGTAYRSGYFLSERFLVGTRIEYQQVWLNHPRLPEPNGYLGLQPFLRYYLFDLGSNRSTSIFGEAGFGTITFGEAQRFRQDAHVALGVETRLADGMSAITTFQYHRQAAGRNALSLSLGTNLQTGLLAASAGTAFFRKGTWTTNGQLGRVLVAVGKSTPFTDDRLSLHLRPTVGYVIRSGWLVEVESEWQREVTTPYTDWNIEFYDSYSYDRRAVQARLRYYPYQGPRRLFPFAMIGAGAEWLRNPGVYGDPLFTTYRAPHVGAGGGVTYLLASRVAADLTLMYRRELVDQPEEQAWHRSIFPEYRVTGSLGLKYVIN